MPDLPTRIKQILLLSNGALLQHYKQYNNNDLVGCLQDLNKVMYLGP